MNITIIGTAFPFRGGLSAFNERLAAVLQSLGNNVNIETFTTQYPNFLFPGKSQFSDEAAPEELKTERSFSSINPLSWIRLGQKLKKQKPDLIIVKYWLPFMGPAFGTILKIARKNKHTQVISILDNVIPHEHRPGDKQFTTFFLKQVDAFVSMSHEVMQDLKTFEPTKPALFSPHPVYDIYGETKDKINAIHHLGLKEDGKYLLFFGFIRKYKGLDILLEALALPEVKALGVELIVAGEYYEAKENYEQLISQLNIQNSVHLFTDFIPNNEVGWYFSAADCVVQPYRTATQSGISQIAYSFEKPMIVTNVGGLPEIVPNGKVGYVTAVNPQAIATAIVQFYTEEKAAIFAENLVIEKQKYSWGTFVSNLMSLCT